MTFAAWLELIEDDEVVTRPTALRVYARLLRNPKIFTEPQDTKSWALAYEMHADRKSVIEAIDLLVMRGYLIEHARGVNNVRRLTVAAVRAAVAHNRHPNGARRAGGA